MAEIDYEEYKTSRLGLYILLFIILFNSCSIDRRLTHLEEGLTPETSLKSEGSK